MLRVMAMSALALGVLSCSPSEEDAPIQPATGDPKELSLLLEVESAVITADETPKFKARLTNNGDEPVTVVLPGDGSLLGWRTPIVRWNPSRESERDCGNINALKPHEVIELAAGASVELPWIGWPNLGDSGKHHVRLELEHIPELQWSGIPLGEHHAATMTRLRQIPAFNIVSNEVEVEVRPKEGAATPLQAAP